MDRRNPSRDSSFRGNRLSQRGMRIIRNPRSQMMIPKPPPQINYSEPPTIINKLTRNIPKPPPPPVINYGAGPNLQHLTHRIIRTRPHHPNPHIIEPPPPPFKHKRETVFPKRHDFPLRNVPHRIHTPINPNFNTFFKPNPPIMQKSHNLNTYMRNFNRPHFKESPVPFFRPKEPVVPMPMPPRMVYDKMMPFKPEEPFLPFPKKEPPMVFVSPKIPPPLSPINSATANKLAFNMRLDRLNIVLDQVNRVCNKVKFSVPSIFRVRMGYSLRDFEQYYLYNVDRVYGYLLFLFLLGGYKESLSFATNTQTRDDISWDSGKFGKFFNKQADMALVPKSILTTGSINTNIRDVTTNQPSIHNYKPIKWDSEPSLAFTFNNDPPIPTAIGFGMDDLILLVRAISLNTIITNMALLKYLCYMYSNTNNSVLSMLGYYSLICSDEDYIIIISSILPSLDNHQLKMFYSNLANLLDLSRCNLQLYYLERFIERFIPICFSQGMSCWKPVISNFAVMVNPLKLNSAKYMNFCVSLVRTIKSFCDKFVESRSSTLNVFLMSLKLLLQSSDDSRILIRGESTDLIIQIWLNPRGKDIIIKSMNYDLIKILGLLSGIQSIKLNIWSYLLSNDTIHNIAAPKTIMTESRGNTSAGSNENVSPNPEAVDNVLNTLFKTSKSDTNTLINLLSYDESVFIFNLLLYFEAKNVDRCLLFKGIVGINVEKDEFEDLEADMIYKKRVGLFWYLLNYLRVNKGLLQYEKMSLVVRLAYKVYKHYIYSKCLGFKDNRSNQDPINFNSDLFNSHNYNRPINASHMDLFKKFVKKLDKNNNLGLLFEYLLFLLLNNINSSVSCLEVANFKLSIMMDLLMFDYSFNSSLLDKNNNDKNYVSISNTSFLNLVKLNNKNSILVLTNLYSKMVMKNDHGTETTGVNYNQNNESLFQNQESDNNSEMAEDEYRDLDNLLNTTLISSVFANFKDSDASKLSRVNGMTDTSTIRFDNNMVPDPNVLTSPANPLGFLAPSRHSKLLNEKSLLDILLNVNLLVYFLNNNVDILRMLINYLENIVFHYNTEFTNTFCINVISALSASSIFHYLLRKEDVVLNDNSDFVDNELYREKKLRDLRDSFKKVYLHKLLMLYNVNNLDIQHLAINHQLGDQKYVYVKLMVNNTEYNDSLTRFMLIQSYLLVLEFLFNYSFYNNVIGNSTSTSIEISNLGSASSKISATEILLKCLTDHKLVEYIDKITSEDYGLPNYYVSHPLYVADKSGSLSNRNSEIHNTGSSSTSADVTYNFNFSHINDASNNPNTQQALNSKLASVIDTIVSSMLYNELHENNDLETKDMIENNMVKLLSMVYNSSDNGKVILYEFMYYITITSIFSTTFSGNPHFELGGKLTISLSVYNKLIDHLAVLNRTSVHNVLNSSFKAIFRLRFANRVDSGTSVNENTANENPNQIEKNESDGNMEAAANKDNERANETTRSVKNVMSNNSDISILRLVFETIITDQLLWKNFKRFPVILSTFIKITPISNILKFFSSFPDFHLTYSSSLYNNPKRHSNCSLFDILKNGNYAVPVLNKVLLQAMFSNIRVTDGDNAPFSQQKMVTDYSPSLYNEPPYKRARIAETANNTQSPTDYTQLKEDNAQLKQLVNTEWFRFYFLYVQLLVRIYEMKHFGSETVNLERNFYRNFTMPLVDFEHLAEFEYLSKDIVLYLLNFKQITSDNNIVCYMGSSDAKTLFIYYMKGFNLPQGPPTSRNTQNAKHSGSRNLAGVLEDSDEVGVNEDQIAHDIAPLLYLLTKLTLVNNLRILQVITFSVFPILVHTIPNKSIFDAVYNSLLNVREISNSFTFIKFLLLTAIFNWYHKYFFTYNFFIYQYNNNRSINSKLVDKYIEKYVNGDDIEFNFNFTLVKIPIQYIHQLQSLF